MADTELTEEELLELALAAAAVVHQRSIAAPTSETMSRWKQWGRTVGLRRGMETPHANFAWRY